MRSFNSARASPESTFFLLPADDLGEVGLRKKPHRRTGPIVQIGRLEDELLPRLLDETEVGCRPDHRIAQVFRRQTLQRLVEGQRVDEDGARDVSGVGRQAAMVLRVEILRQRTGSSGPRDIVGDGRHIGRLLQTGDDLLPYGFVTRVDVVEV